MVGKRLGKRQRELFCVEEKRVWVMCAQRNRSIAAPTAVGICRWGRAGLERVLPCVCQLAMACLGKLNGWYL